MISKATKRFWKCYKNLLPEQKKLAKETYLKFKQDPYYPSLQFKQVHSTRPIYSVRISLNYRALGVLSGSKILWMWVGKHEEYEKLIKGK